MIYPREGHSLRERDHQLDVMRRIADLALIPPKLNTSPLPQYDYDRLDYGMTIGIERTPKGRTRRPLQIRRSPIT